MLCHLPYSGQVSYFPAKHGPCFPSANSGVRCLHMTGHLNNEVTLPAVTARTRSPEMSL